MFHIILPQGVGLQDSPAPLRPGETMKLTDEEKRLIQNIGYLTRWHYRRLFEEFGPWCCQTKSEAVLALWKEHQLKQIKKKPPAAGLKVRKIRTGTDTMQDFLDYYRVQVRKFMKENNMSNAEVAAWTGLSPRTVQRVKSGTSSFKAFRRVVRHMKMKGMRDDEQGRLIEIRRALWGK